MMPIRDGWMVAEDIAGDPTMRDVPIVFLSARAEQRDRERAHSLGAVGYLTKPLNPVGLSAAIDEILRRIEQGEREQLRAELPHRASKAQGRRSSLTRRTLSCPAASASLERVSKSKPSPC